MRLFLYILGFFISIIALAISGYAFVFFLIGMLPTIVSAFIDKRMSRAASNTIGAFNLMAIFPYLVELWNSGLASSDKAREILTNIYVWFVIYSSSALGWLVIWSLPNIMGNFFVYRCKQKIESYRKEQEQIYEEWQVDVSQTTFREYLAGKIIEENDKDNSKN
jgi:hypothetical protein